jgi:hypothetical protein
MRKWLFCLAGLSLFVLAFHGTAQAQGVGGLGGNAALPNKPKDKAAVAPPDALPGARVDKERVTPAERSTADLKPTDALFDSINRGDITTARDAISRGADLQGHNLLGMTPLELSVDLGRNDITFLILSYRGVDGALPSGRAPAAPPAPTRVTRAEQRRAAQEAAAAQARAARAAAAQPAARSYASDGGTPVPSAGFLGFGN